jgi:hypothetical protein
MASLITEHRVDDLHYQHEGEKVVADETVSFGLDGKTYKVDLTAQNAKTLREMLEPYITVATEERLIRQRPTRDEMRAMRDWGRQHGWQLSDRGRIPSEVRKAYESRDDE